MNTARSSRRLRVLGVSVLSAATLVACSSSGGSTGATTVATPTGSAALSAADMSALLSYTGGKAGAASGTPVTLGFINSQGGTNGFPEYTTAVNAAVTLLNTELGGINGHPVELSTCFVASADEQGQTCAQQFLSNGKVVGILQADLGTGVVPFHSTLAGAIPVVGVNPTDLSDTNAKNAYYIEGGQFSAPAIVSYLVGVKKVKSVALLSAAGLPPAVAAAQLLTAGFKAAGVSVTQATFSPTGTDFLGPVTASGASKADAFVPLVVTPPQCIGVANAVKQTGVSTPVVALNACLGPALKSALGDYPKWTYLNFTVNTDATDTDPTTQAQVAAFKSFFAPLASQIPIPGVAIQELQQVLTVAKIAGASSAEPTRASLGTAIAAFTGPVFLGSPTVKFGANPVLPNIGAPSARFYAYGGNGSWTDQTGGQWVTAGAPPR